MKGTDLHIPAILKGRSPGFSMFRSPNLYSVDILWKGKGVTLERKGREQVSPPRPNLQKNWEIPQEEYS